MKRKQKGTEMWLCRTMLRMPWTERIINEELRKIETKSKKEVSQTQNETARISGFHIGILF